MKKKKLNEAFGAWGIVTQKKDIKLSQLAKEAWEPTKQEEPQMSSEDKKKFMEAISNFANLGDSIYREHSLQEITENIKALVEAASHITVTETEDWFDRVTVQRHMKQLGESYKTFEKTAKQIAELQQRLEACYEDIGSTLGRYYKINEFEQKPEDTSMSEMVKEHKFKKKITEGLKFKDFDVDVKFPKYTNNNRVAIQLVDSETREPVATATVNPSSVGRDIISKVGKDDVVIKDYAENSGIVDFLVKNKIIEEPHDEIQSGFVKLKVARLVKP